MFSKKCFTHYRETFRLAWPVALGQAGHMITGIADSIMVGRVGTAPLAAASLANSLFSILIVFGIGIAFGMTPHVAEADGKKDLKSCTSLLRNGFMINMVLGFGLFLLVYNLSFSIHYFDQEKDVADLAVPYFKILSASILPLMLFLTFKQFAEGLSFTKHAMYASLGSNLINVGLNYVFIYGHFGFEPMGLDGAGYATLISRIIMGVWMLGYVLFNKNFKKFRAGFIPKRFSKEKIKKILAVGVPSGLQFVFEIGAFAVAAIMVGKIGKVELAAHQIALSMAAATYMLASGLSAGTTVRVGNFVGKKDFASLKTAGKASNVMAVVFMGICATAFILLNDVLPQLFVDKADPLAPEVTALASSLLIIAAVFQISDGVQVTSLGALRGLPDVKIPTLITFIVYWIIALPVGYLAAFTFGYGAQGVWFGLLTGLTISATLLFFRFRKLSQKLINEAS